MIASLLAAALLATSSFHSLAPPAPPPATGEVEEPTAEEVLAAVRDWFGDDASRRRARGRLAAWGESALPAVRELACGGVAFMEQWALVCALREVETKASVDLLVEILAGKTRIQASQALSTLIGLEHDAALRGRLRAHPDFEPAMIRFGRRGSWLERGRFADVAVVMGWKDAVPLIEAMLEDPNQDLRRTAAEALEKLTGEEVELELAAARFPAERLVAGLVGEPRSPWKGRDGESADFSLDYDGQPRLCVTGGTTLRFHGSEGRLERTQELPEHESGHPEYAFRALALPRDGDVDRIALLASLSSFAAGDPTYVTVMSSSGEVAWKHIAPKSGIEGATLLFTERGVQGLVVDSGSQHLIALDHEGHVLWQRDGFLPAYALCSHPELPGVLYVVFGDLTRFEVSAESYRPVRKSSASGVYATDAALFPDAAGRPALVVAGSGPSSTPTLLRVDEKGKKVWEATLPGGFGRLAMLEPPGAPRLFVVTVDTGRLLVVDEDGTLLHDSPLPGAPTDDGKHPTYDLDAGELASGEHAIFLRLLGRSYLYPVDPSRL